MIPLFLQDSMTERLSKLFEGTLFQNVKGERVPLNIYRQHLPIIKAKSREESIPYPFITVKLNQGSQQDRNSQQLANIELFIGLYDDKEDNQGYQDVAIIIEKIYENFMKTPYISQKYELSGAIEWSIYEEDVHPFFFGGLNTHWLVPTISQDLEGLI